MGLDSYIKASLYISPHRRDTYEAQQSIVRALNIYPDEGSSFIEISFTALYWRNCWYMESRFSSLNDDNNNGEMGMENLKSLKQDCIDIINTSNKNEQLDLFKRKFKYDDVDSLDSIIPILKKTVDRLSHIIESPQYQECTFQYQSSW